MTPMRLRPTVATSTWFRIASVAGLVIVGVAVFAVRPAGATSRAAAQAPGPSVTAAVPTAPPTTAEAQQRSEIDDPAARTMRLVIWALVGLGVVIACGTGYFWVRTRPPLLDPITVVPLTEVTGRVEQVAEVADVGRPGSVRSAASIGPIDEERSRRSLDRWGETYAPLPSAVPASGDVLSRPTEEEK